MKDRDIEKRLRDETKNAVPDIYDKILLSAQAEGLFDAKERSASKKKSVAQPRRKLLVPFASAVAAAAVCLAVVLPITLGGDGGITPTDSLASAEAYAIGAVSTVRLLGNETTEQRSLAVAALSEETEDTGVKAQIKKFNEYFGALDGCFGGDTVSATAAENDDPRYPYDVKLTIVGNGFGGSSATYILYYNETKDVGHNNGNGGKTRYGMVGVMVSDGVERCLDGERLTVSNNGVEKNKVKIRAYADRSDKKTYIETEQEISETGDDFDGEYVYGVYKNGKLVEQTAVKYETKSNNVKERSVYSIEFRQGGNKGKYKIKREVKNAIVEIKVEYALDDDNGQFEIKTTGDNGYVYSFEDGTTVTV